MPTPRAEREQEMVVRLYDLWRTPYEPYGGYDVSELEALEWAIRTLCAVQGLDCPIQRA